MVVLANISGSTEYRTLFYIHSIIIESSTEQLWFRAFWGTRAGSGGRQFFAVGLVRAFGHLLLMSKGRECRMRGAREFHLFPLLDQDHLTKYVVVW